VIVGVIGVIIMVMGGQAMLDGRMTVGEFLNYILFTGLMAAPVMQIASIGTQVTEAFAGLDRIHELMEMRTEDDEDASRAPLGPLAGAVTFENVTFEYNPGVEVLKGVSFQAPAGTTTALVGSSGSGKSTLISLVMAFNRPKSGRILVDGRDLATVRLRDYRSQLGVVLQDNFLFDGSVIENIRYGRPDATLEQIRDVSRIAHADEFIEGFERKYDTVVGERGVKLSGGQRQRIAIARAILRDAPVLLLDEATSALDAESERAVQLAVEAMAAGRTTLIVAHRLATVKKADRILVFEAGRIVADGTHEALVAEGGLYARLARLQFTDGVL
jgi:subfamily B ATP-binding cassette protein MsbA